jgi:hypothetical protein
MIADGFKNLRNQVIIAGTQIGLVFATTAATLTLPASAQSLLQNSRPLHVYIPYDLVTPPRLQNINILPRSPFDEMAFSLPSLAIPQNNQINTDIDSNYDPSDPKGWPPDPRKVVFITPGVSYKYWPYEEISIHNHILPHAIFVDVSSHNFQVMLRNAVEKQMMATGTMEEAVLDSHGNTDTLSAEKENDKRKADKTAIAKADRFFDDMLALQLKHAEKPAYYYLILGCDVATDLGPQRVAALREYAVRLGAEIVVTKSIRWGNSLQQASFAHFGADGTVSLDPMSTDPKTLQKNLEINNRVARRSKKTADDVLTENSDTWFACHDHKTQAEGAACQDKLRNDNFARAERHHVSGRWPMSLPYNLRLSVLGAPAWNDIYQTFYQTKNRRHLSVGAAHIVTPKKIHEAQAAIAASYDHGSTSYDVAAVKAHEKFLHSLSAKGRAAVVQLVHAFEHHFPEAPAYASHAAPRAVITASVLNR